MAMFNWANNFEEPPSKEMILKKVRRAEIKYWVFLVISILIAIAGANLIENAPADDLKKHAMGLLFLIIGIVNIAVIKLWAHILLTMYYSIWHRISWVESEIRKSEAEDL